MSESVSRVVSLDVSDALSAPGVVDILTQNDVAAGRETWGLVDKNEPIFASSEVSYHGQIMGVIVCEDEAAGRAARKRVRVQYEDLEPVFDLKTALAKGQRFGPVRKLRRDQGFANKGNQGRSTNGFPGAEEI